MAFLGGDDIVELSCYHLFDTCGVRMSNWQRKDFSYFGEASMDFEDDGLDKILSQSLDLFEEQESSVQSREEKNSHGQWIDAAEKEIDRRGKTCVR